MHQAASDGNLADVQRLPMEQSGVSRRCNRSRHAHVDHQRRRRPRLPYQVCCTAALGGARPWDACDTAILASRMVRTCGAAVPLPRMETWIHCVECGLREAHGANGPAAGRPRAATSTCSSGCVRTAANGTSTRAYMQLRKATLPYFGGHARTAARGTTMCAHLQPRTATLRCFSGHARTAAHGTAIHASVQVPT